MIMQKAYSILALIVVFLIHNEAHSAVFTLRYRGYNYVHVFINGSRYDLGGKVKDLPIDTGGINDIDQISWDEGFTNSNYSVWEKTFTLTLPKKIWAWDVGGEFIIYNEGEYSYRFGTAGSSQGKIQPVGPNKVMNI
jgi:hypothetical protein